MFNQGPDFNGEDSFIILRNGNQLGVMTSNVEFMRACFPDSDIIESGPVGGPNHSWLVFIHFKSPNTLEVK